MDPAPETRPEVTDNQDFYRIDINLEPPRIDAATWKLPIDGLVQTAESHPEHPDGATGVFSWAFKV